MDEWAQRNALDILVTLLRKGSKVKLHSFLGADDEWHEDLYIVCGCLNEKWENIFFSVVYFVFDFVILVILVIPDNRMFSKIEFILTHYSKSQIFV